MKKIILLNKKEGETPLFALENFRLKHKEYKDVKMTYAGRLDPMASGLLLVLAGENVKNKEKYIKLNKEYTFEVLFGFSTDTYDILGKITDSRNIHYLVRELKKEISEELKSFLGENVQKYPIYSSKTVNGKPLFMYGRAGQKVVVPEKKIIIKKIKLEKIAKINNTKLFENIKKRLKKVNGDFRQKEIIKIWEKQLLHKKNRNQYFIAGFKIKCSSGTYVRSLAYLLGKKMKIPTLAYSIKRTKIGKYVI